jgi:CheY-like chemotaxis protein
MTVMNGFQVMEDLKKNNKDAYLPIIVLACHSSHALRALQEGAKDFISKPFDLSEIKIRIRNLLEIGLLYKKLENCSKLLEQSKQDRTAELIESEIRFSRLTELALDCHWEQDENMHFTLASGPILDMLGIQGDSLLVNSNIRKSTGIQLSGWNEAEQKLLRANIAARQPFLDFIISRIEADGSQQKFQVSGEPMFDQSCRFIGYRGVGVELSTKAIL